MRYISTYNNSPSLSVSFKKINRDFSLSLSSPPPALSLSLSFLRMNYESRNVDREWTFITQAQCARKNAYYDRVASGG